MLHRPDVEEDVAAPLRSDRGSVEDERQRFVAETGTTGRPHVPLRFRDPEDRNGVPVLRIDVEYRLADFFRERAFDDVIRCAG